MVDGGGAVGSTGFTSALVIETVGVNVADSCTGVGGAEGAIRVGAGDGTMTIGDAGEVQARMGTKAINNNKYPASFETTRKEPESLGHIGSIWQHMYV